MKITDYKNTNQENVLAQKHNFWLGISLGNKYFSKGALTDYMQSMAQLTKDKVLIVVADDPQAINYEVFERMPSATAQKKALRKGEEVFELLEDIRSSLTPDSASKLKLIRWSDIAQQDWYQHRVQKFKEAFAINSEFQAIILQIVRLNMGDRVESLSQADLEQLAQYVISELPIFIGALKIDGVEYDLHVYPGLSMLDELILDIQNKSKFSQLFQDIEIGKNLAIIEAYAE